MIGKIVSHYEIVEPLGAGGMGVVYKARDRKLGRFVALKFLTAQIGVGEEIKQRFVNEARAASALDHANICTVHEIDETDDGQLFIVMAFYEGESLRERIARGFLPTVEALEIGVQVARGLEVAHEHGILHRDIKPANIFLTRRGEVKILDFGLAKVTGTTKITRTGTSMGTLNYMPPEQLMGQPVDRRADVWALGAVVYEMLTGCSAFGGDNEGAVVYAILHAEPQAPSALRPGTTTDIDRLVAMALAKRVAERYASVGEMRADLEALRAATISTDGPTRLAADDQPTLLQVGQRAGTAATESATDWATPRARSVAVFDFANIAKDPSADWLSGGMAETLAVDLKKISALKVVGRQRVRQVAGGTDVSSLGDEELEALGARLGARWLFWGGFQKLGEAIRITAHSFDVAENRTVETVKVDGSMGDIFTLQDRILTSLTGGLELEISESEVHEIGRAETLDLEAYEYCAKARQLVYEMGPRGFEEAAGYLQKAVELDPGYAMAYSSLGQLHSMRFIAGTDRTDLEKAILHLQKAVELDPELGDPYGWLAYAYSRERRYREAIQCGQRAVELEPDNAFSHYFLSVALWLRAQDEYRTEGLSEAIAHLRRVTELSPRYQPGHQIMGGIYLSAGQYERARACLQRAAEIEESADWEMARFVGALGMLGRVAFCQGRLGEAADWFDKARRVSGGIDHVYTPASNALGHCWRGDLLLRLRRYDQATRAFREAQRQASESPRSLGIGWPLLRAHLGLAQSFHHLGMRREAQAGHQQAAAILASRHGYDFNGIWEGGEAAVHFELASYLSLAHRLEDAMASLERAVACGWMETPRLESDPNLDGLRQTARFQEISVQLSARPPLP